MQSIPNRDDSPSHRFNVRAFGAIGDGRTLDTAAINRAIAAAHTSGGGTVVFGPGEFLAHSIRLRSYVTLHFEAGAVLVAADPPGYDAPEDAPPNVYQDFGHSRFHNSLIWGEDLDHIALCGPGRIYGRGLSRGNGRIALPVGQVAPQPPGHLPDVLEADGFHDGTEDSGGARVDGAVFAYPNPRDTLPSGVGNKAIALRECRHVIVRDLTILHGGHFAILASACHDMAIENVFIDTNRDGIDIDGCSNVRIARCTVNSPWDDGICLKSSCGSGLLRPAENITISDCYVSGFVEGTLLDGTRSRLFQHRGGPIGRIKLGTEASGGFRNVAITNCVFEFCRGLALEQVDGAMMENIVVSNISMRDVMNAPIFIRLGGRLRAPGAEKAGTARGITISNVVAHHVAPEHGIFVAGLPGHPVRDVLLSGIQLHSRGGGTDADRRRIVPEMVRDYPEPMLFGTLPAWGIYARHVVGLHLRDISFHLLGPDARPAAHFEDVDALDLSNIRVTPGTADAEWTFTQTTNVRAHFCPGAPASLSLDSP